MEKLQKLVGVMILSKKYDEIWEDIEGRYGERFNRFIQFINIVRFMIILLICKIRLFLMSTKI